MARPSAGARLVLCGPDKQFGARRKPGLTRYIWHVRDGQHERSTGKERHERAAADRWLSEYIASKYKAPRQLAKPDNEYAETVADALFLYGRERGVRLDSATNFK